MANSTLTSTLAIIRLGMVEYEKALRMQRDLHEKVASGREENSLLLLEHPSIYTAGKRTLDSEKPLNGAPVVEVDRGGKITWHGPGQIVGYPIIALSNPHELVGFVRTIETALIKVCREFGIEGQCIKGRSGVWIKDSKGERKIGAIGIRVARGVSMHGFALNINPDLTAFSEIIPCGISDADVTSFAVELGRSIEVDEVLPVVEKYMYEALVLVAR